MAEKGVKAFTGAAKPSDPAGRADSGALVGRGWSLIESLVKSQWKVCLPPTKDD